MHCAQARNLIALMVGNDLDALERPAVERHLAQCTCCHDYHTEMARMRSDLEAAGTDEIPQNSGSLWPAIRPAVRRESANRNAQRFNGWIAGLAVAASVMAVITMSDDMVSPPIEQPGTHVEGFGVSSQSGELRWPLDRDVWPSGLPNDPQPLVPSPLPSRTSGD